MLSNTQGNTKLNIMLLNIMLLNIMVVALKRLLLVRLVTNIQAYFTTKRIDISSIISISE